MVGVEGRTKRHSKNQLASVISSRIASSTSVSYREMLASTFRTSLFLTTLFVLLAEISTKKVQPKGPITDAIQSGAAADYDRKKCIWRRGSDRDSCPDPDVKIYLYAKDRPRRELDSRESDWLRQDYDPTKENAFLIHGYAGTFK